MDILRAILSVVLNFAVVSGALCLYILALWPIWLSLAAIVYIFSE